MFSNRVFNSTALLLASGTLALGLAACGSDDGGTGGTTSPTPDTAGQVTPKKDSPASAGDKKKNAPDDSISNRPGGPKPTS